MKKDEFLDRIYFAITRAYFYFLLMKTGQTDHYWTEEKLKKDIFENFEKVVSCKLYGDNRERREKWYNEATTWDDELEQMMTVKRANRSFSHGPVKLRIIADNEWSKLSDAWAKFIKDTKMCIFYKDSIKLKEIVYNI